MVSNVYVLWYNDIPNLGLFVDLHAQLASILVNRTIVDTASSRVVDHSTSPLVAIREGEAHLHVGAQGTTVFHEPRALIRISDEHCLLDSLVDDELVLDEIVLDLLIVNMNWTQQGWYTTRTLSALNHVSKEGSGS